MNPEDDTRNLINKFKGRSVESITEELDQSGSNLIIALENTERDFNMGTIVRSANAFGVRDIYIIGRRQWNKRGAMMTDKYLHVHYLKNVADFASEMSRQDRAIIAVDNIAGSVELSKTKLPKNAVLVFGQEGPGISDKLAKLAEKIVAIEQFGSTRSINVGVAAGVVMYEWTRQNHLS